MLNLVTDKKKFISGSVRKIKFNLKYTDAAYEVLSALEKEFNTVTEKAEFDKLLEKLTDAVQLYKTDNEVMRLSEMSKYLAYDNKSTSGISLCVGGVKCPLALPDMFASHILSCEDKDINVEAIVKLVVRFVLNPLVNADRFNMLANYMNRHYTDSAEYDKYIEEGYSKEIALERSTYPDLQITKNGYLKTSKVVDEVTKVWSIKLDENKKPVLKDGKPVKELKNAYDTIYLVDEVTGKITEKVNEPEFFEDRKFKPAIWSTGDNFYSGDTLGYKYEVGKLASLRDWKLVDCVDNEKHQRGLHAGGLTYVEGYLHGNRQLLECFICPSKIAKFTDYGMGELTTLEMYIHGCSTLDGDYRSLYHTSSYDSLNEGDLIKLRETILEAYAGNKPSDLDKFRLALIEEIITNGL